MVHKRIGKLIKMLKINQGTFADRCNISKAYVSELLNGKVGSITTEKFKKICDEFEVSPIWLLYGKGDPFQYHEFMALKSNQELGIDKYTTLAKELRQLERRDNLEVSIHFKSKDSADN